MRCLYCGKELAFYKRLAGAEFCSGEHRERYRLEYNQLAVNRLLEAKPAEDPGPRVKLTEPVRTLRDAEELEQKSAAKSAPSAVAAKPKSAGGSVADRIARDRNGFASRRNRASNRGTGSDSGNGAGAGAPDSSSGIPLGPATPPAAPSSETSAPVIVETASSPPVAEPPSEPPSPEVAGRIEFKMQPSLAALAAMVKPEIELVLATVPARPRYGREPVRATLAQADRIPLATLPDLRNTPRERVEEGRLEPREFAGPGIITRVELNPGAEERFVAAPREEPIDLPEIPFRKPGDAHLWTAGRVEFRGAAPEPASLSALGFATTGFPEVVEPEPESSSLALETGNVLDTTTPELASTPELVVSEPVMVAHVELVQEPAAPEAPVAQEDAGPVEVDPIDALAEGAFGPIVGIPEPALSALLSCNPTISVAPQPLEAPAGKPLTAQLGAEPAPAPRELIAVEPSLLEIPQYENARLDLPQTSAELQSFFGEEPAAASSAESAPVHSQEATASRNVALREPAAPQAELASPIPPASTPLSIVLPVPLPSMPSKIRVELAEPAPAIPPSAITQLHSRVEELHERVEELQARVEEIPSHPERASYQDGPRITAPAVWPATEARVPIQPAARPSIPRSLGPRGTSAPKTFAPVAPRRGPIRPVEDVVRELPNEVAREISPSATRESQRDFKFAPHDGPSPVISPRKLTIAPVAAGKGKAAQIFPAAILGAPEIPCPRMETLPVRPLMILGAESAAPPPAPVSLKPELSLLTPASREEEFKLPELKIDTRGPSRSTLIIACAAVALVLIIVIVLGAMRNNSTAVAPPPALATSALPSEATAWISDFAPDPKHLHTVSVLRSSMEHDDYEIAFESTIQAGAVGWVFRAKDFQNYWVARIEERRTAAGPVTTLARYPVVNGVPLLPVRKPVMTKPLAGQPYTIRTQVSGNRFTIWIQGQKVDEWTDDRLMTGGAGLYSESGERATVAGKFSAVPLPAQK